MVSEASSGVGSSHSGTTTTTMMGLDGGAAGRRAAIHDPFASVPPHKRITVPKIGFATRQVDWSPGGEWAVAVGDHGMVVLFRRWD